MSLKLFVPEPVKSAYVVSELSVVKVTVPALAVNVPSFVQLPVTVILLPVLVVAEIVISFTVAVLAKERLSAVTERDDDEDIVSLKVTFFPLAEIAREFT